MTAAPRVGMSACLAGRCTRYDGRHKRDDALVAWLGPAATIVPVCPEEACGLGTPREPVHLVGSPAAPRLVTVRTGADRTDRMERWMDRWARGPQARGLAGFVLKSRSPSCGLRDAAVRRTRGGPAHGPGLFTRFLTRRFPGLPVEDEIGLRDPDTRERFLARVRSAAAGG